MNFYRKSALKALIVSAIALINSGTAVEAMPSASEAARPFVAVPVDQAAADRAKFQADSLSRDLAMLELSMASLRAKIEASNDRLSRLRERYARAKAEYGECYSSYEKRLIAIYKHRDEGALLLILRSNDLRDLAVGISALIKASDEDAGLLKNLMEKKREAEEAKTSAEEENSALQEMEMELKRESADLKRRLDAAMATYRGFEVLLDLTRKEEVERLKREASSANLPIGKKPTLKEVEIGSRKGFKFLTSSNGPAAFKSTGRILNGVASWYGNEFNGRPTSNGETFNEEDFTAASKELPFGTYLAVSYKGRGVIVRVNDRGPFVKGRFLDLSKGAARALGLGLGEVEAEIVVPAD